MKRLILATGNAHKAQEIRAMLKDLDLEILTMKDVCPWLRVAENGSTFRENAWIKARAVREATGESVLADDSGLEIDALYGAPGVHSARFLGETTPYATRFAVLLETLSAVPDEKRGADFCCVMAAVLDGAEFTEEGRVDGLVARRAAGENGFGYDPLFWLPEYGCTMAELGPEMKNTLSHRCRALAAMRPHIEAWLKDGRE